MSYQSYEAIYTCGVWLVFNCRNKTVLQYMCSDYAQVKSFLENYTQNGLLLAA